MIHVSGGSASDDHALVAESNRAEPGGWRGQKNVSRASLLGIIAPSIWIGIMPHVIRSPRVTASQGINQILTLVGL